MSLLYLASFTWHDVFKVHACWDMHQYFVLWSNSILLYKYTKFSLSAHQLGYFHLLPIMNNAAIIIHVRVFL